MAEDTKDNGVVIPPEKLLKKLKANLIHKLNAGEVGLASEIERIAELERKLKEQAENENPSAPECPAEEELQGIPPQLKIKRPYTMSEDARRARQQNALKSTGPKTPEGKAKSAANGCNWKHGRYSRSVIRKTFGLCTDACDKYPCDAVDREETGKGELCLDHEGLPLKIKTLVEDAKSGNIEDAKELMASLLALEMRLIFMLNTELVRSKEGVQQGAVGCARAIEAGFPIRKVVKGVAILQRSLFLGPFKNFSGNLSETAAPLHPNAIFYFIFNKVNWVQLGVQHGCSWVQLGCSWRPKKSTAPWSSPWKKRKSAVGCRGAVENVDPKLFLWPEFWLFCFRKTIFSEVGSFIV